MLLSRMRTISLVCLRVKCSSEPAKRSAAAPVTRHCSTTSASRLYLQRPFQPRSAPACELDAQPRPDRVCEVLNRCKTSCQC
eukprot:3646998-Rhodomonas_salina.3